MILRNSTQASWYEESTRKQKKKKKNCKKLKSDINSSFLSIIDNTAGDHVKSITVE